MFVLLLLLLHAASAKIDRAQNEANVRFIADSFLSRGSLRVGLPAVNNAQRGVSDTARTPNDLPPVGKQPRSPIM